MKNEYKIALALLIVGGLAIGGLYYKKSHKVLKVATANKSLDKSDKKIIIPDTDEDSAAKIPAVEEYLADLKKLYAKGKSTLPLQKSELDDNGVIAQNVALKSKEFLSDTKMDNKLLHNDIMRVVPAISSMLNDKSKKECQSSVCYVVEKYNYALNSTTRAIVDVNRKKVISIQRYSNSQPNISVRLTNIAKEIALNNPKVIKELGHTPTPSELSMANVRSNLQESPCEDKNHLCVAPTFAEQKKEQALWAIVDLTDLKLAAAKWAGLGKTYTPACIDERTLENRYIMKNFCQKDTNLSKDGWSLKYHLTGSDGLEIRDIKFKDKSVAKSLKVVDWHVAYRGKGADKLDTSTPTIIAGRRVEFIKGANNEYTFGYNDAMGCPMFSTSVVLAFNGPQIKELKNKDGKVEGFYILQDFRNPKWPMACNYRYQNRFEFYKDGSFRVVAINLGRGCGNKAIYRPVMRLDISLNDNKEKFSLYNGKSWDDWQIEQGYHSTGKENMLDGKYLYRVTSPEDASDGYYIEPNRGQYHDNSRGDNEDVYVTKYKEDEGNEDLLTLGSCCKLDYDGPEEYTKDKELIENTNTVIWYVPTIQNDDKAGEEYCWADSTIDENGNPSAKVWPCIVGPKFVPIGN